jgi:putative intracellular protease/amidase
MPTPEELASRYGVTEQPASVAAGMGNIDALAAKYGSDKFSELPENIQKFPELKTVPVVKSEQENVSQGFSRGVEDVAATAGYGVGAADAALFPGGDPNLLIGNEQLNLVIQKLNANGSVLGAICAGPILLEQAGLLKNRKIAHGYKGAQLQWLLDRGYFKNTTLTAEAFVVEDNIVTARSDSFIDFAVME